MKTLIEMTDFVLEQDKLEFIPKGEDYADEWSDHCLLKLDKINEYANFLKQPLTLGMFVPADENGNLLEQCEDICACECDKMKAFRQAKERVLFDGFFMSEDKDTRPTNVKSITNGVVHVFWFNNIEKWYLSKGLRTIEDLTLYNLKLTDNALKTIL